MLLKKIEILISLVVVFLLLCVFFIPLFQGKKLDRSDELSWRGISKEIKDYKNETGNDTYWTGTVFSGMPTVLISATKSGNLVAQFKNIFGWIPQPIFILFITFIGFFVLLRVLGVQHWLATIGGVAYMFSSYFFIITAVGHNTKMETISFMAFIVAGIILTYNKKYLIGGIVFASFLSLGIYANHPQVTYYILLLLLLFGLFKLLECFKNKDIGHFLKASFILLIGAVLAIGSNAENLYQIYDYSKISTRGENILHKEGKDTTKSKLAYSTEWSYGKDETLTLLIPNAKGGSSNGRALDEKSETYTVLSQIESVKNPAQLMDNLPTYWGTQVFTEGGVYVGALVFFLFLFGLFVAKCYIRWWLITATVVSILLAWGRNMMPLYEFLYNYFPMFSKFRTPSMILILVEFTMPLLAFIALDRLLKEGKIDLKIRRRLILSFLITVGICILLWIVPSLMGNFKAAKDAKLPDFLQEALVLDRKNLLRYDALRSAIFVSLAFLGIWFYIKEKISKKILLVALSLIVATDMWWVDKRFITESNYTDAHSDEYFEPYFADKEILKDKDLSYRVLDITESPFNSSRASYFHKSIGGYHAAKLRRYQDLIEHNLQPELKQLVSGLKEKQPIDSVMKGLPTLRMLNLRYLIYNPNAIALKTFKGEGNAWFVKDIMKANSPLDELKMIEKIDPSMTAIVSHDESHKIKKAIGITDGQVNLKRYSPNELEYTSQSSNDGLVVFSEIFHPDWQAFVDGKLIPIIRVNYTLMGLELVKGTHKIVLKFQPAKYKIWHIIGLISSIVLIFLVAIVLVLNLKKI